jgi:hypothetical protein
MGKKSICHSIKKVIKRCDFISSPISFTINNEYRYHSFIGGLLYIIFTIITLLYSIYCAWGFLKRKNIDFIYARKIVQSGPSINLREVSFNFGFGLKTFGNGAIYTYPNKDYFTYSVEFIDWIGDEYGSLYKTNVPLKSCEKDDFYNIIDYIFESNNIHSLYCPVISKDLNYTLDGLYTDYYFRYLTLNIHLSEYGLNNLDETKNFLKENPLEMAIYFIDSSYNFKSRKEFVSKKLNYFFRPIDFFFTKYTTLYISPLEFSNDENLIIRKISKANYSIYDFSLDTFQYYQSRTNKDSLIAQIKIQVSSKVFQFQRTYQKLPTFIAELTGFVGMLLIILLAIIRFLERQIIDNKLINHMLNFKGSKFNDVEYFINSFNFDKKYNKISSILSNERIIKNNLSMHKKVSNELNLESENDIKLNSSVNNNNNYHKKTISSIIKYNKNPGRKIIIKDDIKDNLNQENNPQTEETLKNNNEEETHDKINNDKLNSSENLNKNMKKLNQKEKNIKLFPLSYSEYFIASICFCCTNVQKKRKNATKSAEFRIHYFMDIFNFIKKMQEIDLLKYCLFDKDQIMLFDFTSKTPFKIGNDGQEIIFRDREKIMINKKNFEKDDLDDIFNSYRIIRIKDELSYEDIKLMELVKSEVEFLGEA